VQYLHQDSYGSTRLLTNGAGAVVAGYTYDPYGNLKAQTGTVDTALRWNGQYQDVESGLYYLRARYYDPATAQFITRDPMTLFTRSPYGYAADGPLNGADPFGLCWPHWACPVENGVSQGVSDAWNATGGAAVHYVENHTIGVCVNVSAGFGTWEGASGCIASVGGHPTIIGTLAGGGGTPGASLTGGFLLSNAHDPQQLSGWFSTAGASIDVGASVGDEVSVGFDSCGNTIWENQFQIGVGADLPPPAEGHAGASYTWVWSP
jgi:RHS repeat-associated protein